MDEIAEKGLAAHYKYKETKGSDNKFDRWITEIRDLIDSPNANALDFVDEFKLNLFSEEIYIFTPQGDLRVLPTSSTILDFAYDIHTDIGNSCIGAKVNNRLVPLSHLLNSGDQVEIITSPKQRPNDEWLRFVVTARAKQKIKSSLNEEKKNIALDGKETLQRKFKQHNIRFNAENVMALQKFYNQNTATELYYKIAKGKVDLTRLREIENNNGMLQLEKKEPTSRKKKKETEVGEVDKKKETIIIGDDFKNLDYTLSKCCNPIPGDHVFGFITISEGIKIHRNNCPNAQHLQSKMAYRCMKARWKNQQLTERVASIRLKGFDQQGLVNRLTEIVSNQLNVNMKSISFETEDGIFEGRIKVLVFDTYHLRELMTNFELVEGVQRVERWDERSSDEEEETTG
jgi:guanosine-3',5'-bis(diphosphate) 3'-pyrophosphohydrolase